MTTFPDTKIPGSVTKIPVLHPGHTRQSPIQTNKSGIKVDTEDLTPPETPATSQTTRKDVPEFTWTRLSGPSFPLPISFGSSSVVSSPPTVINPSPSGVITPVVVNGGRLTPECPLIEPGLVGVKVFL